MFVYIWKHPNNVPFYVGATKDKRRADPTSASPRSAFCKVLIKEIGAHNVIVEVIEVGSLKEARTLEAELINKYGRITQGTGTLANMRSGGEGLETMPLDAREKASIRMREKNPMHNPETRAKAVVRMCDPHVLAKYSGENNPAKRPEVRAKIKAKWADPEYRAKMKTRPPRKAPSEAEREAARERLLDPNNPMRAAHIHLNTDPAIKAKRDAAKRTPEARAKTSTIMKEIWAKRKAAKQ